MKDLSLASDAHDVLELRAHQRQVLGQPGVEGGAREQLLVPRVGGHDVQREALEDLAVRPAAPRLGPAPAFGRVVEMAQQVVDGPMVGGRSNQN